MHDNGRDAWQRLARIPSNLESHTNLGTSFADPGRCPVLQAIAGRQAETFGVDRGNLLDEARRMAIAALRSEQTTEHLASRVAERQLRGTILQRIPDAKSS